MSWLFIAVFVVALLNITPCVDSKDEANYDPKDPLLLTPYIERNETEKARNLSRVSFFRTLAKVEAFSGFFTIDNTTDTNYFFLYTKANDSVQEKKEGTVKKPLILWLFGGPGMSALFAQFLYNGPVRINEKGALTKRDQALTDFADVIYLDQPAGAGFSFGNESGYSKTMEEMSDNIVKFLKQFLEMFPEHKDCDFYVAGESYGARNSMHLGHTLLGHNPTSLKFKGVINGVGYLGPVLKGLNPSEFLYQIGMVDANGRKQFEKAFNEIETLFRDPRTILFGLQKLTQTVMNAEGVHQTLYKTLTGHTFDGNALYSSIPRAILYYYYWVNRIDIKKQLHVGVDATIEKDRGTVVGYIAAGDFLQDWSNATENVLNKSKLLYYFGQFDTVFPLPNIDKYFHNLTWAQSQKLDEAPREIIYDSNKTEVNAYRKDVSNLTYVMVTGVGHYVSMEKPEVVYTLIKEFVS